MRARLPLLRHFSKLISLVTTVAALSAMAAVPCLAEEKKLSLYLPVPGPSPAGNIRVQLTTFKVPGHSLPLSLLETSMADDQALFLRLAGMAAEGSAEITADQHFTVPAGKEMNDQLVTRHQPFPTEFAASPDGLTAFPKEHETKSIGPGFSVEFIHRTGNAPDRYKPELTGVIQLQNQYFSGFTSWPLRPPGRPEGDGIISQPKFFHERTSTLFKTADSAHHLLSVIRCAGEEENGGSETYSWTWARAFPESQSSSTAAVHPETALRLHLLSFELPLAIGHELLHAACLKGDDTELLTALLKNGSNYEARLCKQLILRIESASGVPDGSLESARSLPGGQQDWHLPPRQAPMPVPASGSLDSIQEYRYPTDFSGLMTPESFDARNSGTTFQATAVKVQASGSVDLQVELQDRPYPDMFSWQGSESPRIPLISMPSPSRVELKARLQVRPGGVYCVGAITLPEFFRNQVRERPMMRIHLVKVSNGKSGNRSATAGWYPQGFTLEVLSFSPDDALQLQAVSSSSAEREPFLNSLLDSGSVHRLAWGQIAGSAESNPGIQAEVEVPTPLACSYGSANTLRPSLFHYFNLGHSLQFIQLPGHPRFQFRHGHATISQPGEAELIQAADEGAKTVSSGTSNAQKIINRKLGPNDQKPWEGALPKPERFEIDVATDIPPTAPFQILSLAPADVPAGHPEEGRWHAALLRTVGVGR